MKYRVVKNKLQELNVVFEINIKNELYYMKVSRRSGSDQRCVVYLDLAKFLPFSDSQFRNRFLDIKNHEISSEYKCKIDKMPVIFKNGLMSPVPIGELSCVCELENVYEKTQKRLLFWRTTESIKIGKKILFEPKVTGGITRTAYMMAKGAKYIPIKTDIVSGHILLRAGLCCKKFGFITIDELFNEEPVAEIFY